MNAETLDLVAPPAPEGAGAFHALDVQTACERLSSDPERGLSAGEARTRLERVGPNSMPQPPRPSTLKRILAQFADPLVGALLAAAVVAVLVAVGEAEHEPRWWVRFSDSMAILLIVVLNAALGFFQERRAERALDALEKMAAPEASVVRDGRVQRLAARELVPGDVVELEAGDVVPADVRLLDAHSLTLQEAALTGESTGVDKKAATTLPAEAPLADRVNMAYTGTAVSRGHGRGLVVGTGAATELGRIGTLISSAKKTDTPLEDQLGRLGTRILMICVGLSLALFVLGVTRDSENWTLWLLTAVSLAVAAIPEGLPAITTITLALGMQRMAHRGAIVRKLPAVETLGSATIICSDKTGTLTQNAMTVRVLQTIRERVDVSGEGYAPEGRLSQVGGEDPEDTIAIERLVRCGVLCNTANLESSEGKLQLVGDPTEVALLTLADKRGEDREKLRASTRIVHQVPFDSDRKRMAVVVEQGDRRTAYVKGSAEVVLERCTRVLDGDQIRAITDVDREALEQAQAEFAAQALRVLALAERPDPGDEPEEDLVLLGLVAMLDPPRPEVLPAIQACRDAGIEVCMITGDHRDTAVAIARQLNLWREGARAMSGAELEATPDEELGEAVRGVVVFARVSAEQKLRIVRALRKNGNVVAMTGDGVNDAPALKEAQIGVSMGKGGTEVAREASDIVLSDDNFATIVHAVAEGRAIFSNIRKFIFFLNSANAGLVTAVIAASFVAWIPPLTPLQLLWINLVTNGLPALALGVDPPDGLQMKDKPRPVGAGLVAGEDLLGIGVVGLVMGLGGLAILFTPMWWPELYGHVPRAEAAQHARTLAFIQLALSPLFHALNAQSPRRSLFQMHPFRNRLLWGAVLVSALLQLLTVFLTPLHTLFHTYVPNAQQWGLILAVAVLPIPAMELLKLIMRSRFGSR